MSRSLHLMLVKPETQIPPDGPSKVRERSRRSGVSGAFTLIEVMITMVVLAIGIVAVLALLTSSIESNGIAQENTVASSIAEEFIEILRVDALRWNYNGTDGTLDLNDTSYLKQADVGTGWRSYVGSRVNGNLQVAADGGSDASLRYCVFYRTAWAGASLAGGTSYALLNEVLRVDVTVVWPRRGNDYSSLFSNCTGTAAQIATFLAPSNNAQTRQVRLSTYIRRNVLAR